MRFVTRFEPITEGVTEIHFAGEVFFEEVRFEFLQHPGDGAVEQGGAFFILKIFVHALRAMRFEQVEEWRVFDDGQLDDLTYAIEDVAARQCLEEGFVEQDGLGCVEGPQTVLVAVEVDAGFDPDGSVYVAHEGGGDFDVRHAASVTCGDKSDQVGEDSATDGNDRFVATMDGEAVQFADEGEIMVEGFILFIAGEDDDLRFDMMV